MIIFCPLPANSSLAPQYQSSFSCPSQKIIIDTDPGQDDAIGILLAFASQEELDLLGIVTVAGNVPLELTSRNALKLCELATKPGKQRFLQGALDRGKYDHLLLLNMFMEKQVLDGADLPAPTISLQNQHGVDWTIETLLSAKDDSITICCFAPQSKCRYGHD